MKKITFAFLMLFTSLVAVAQCDFQLELNDSFGDGWNGNSIDVIVNGTIVLDDATLGGGSQGFINFAVSDGDAITFTVDDSGSFDDEVSYRILDNEGVELAAGDLTTVPGEITASCECAMQLVLTSQLVPDCDNDTFSVEINVTDLGSSASVSIENDLNDDTTEITEAGTFVVGPFDSGSIVSLTAVSDVSDCSLSVGSFTFDCEIPNDNCEFAIPVTDGDVININTDNATIDNAGCNTSATSAGVWYFINDGGTAIDVTIDTNGSSFDTELSYFTGTCDALVCVGNDDDGGDGTQSLLSFTTAGDGENIYILATGFGSNTGDLVVNITGAGLLSTDTPSSQLDTFTMFPNPVRETLSISNGSTIENVRVFNLLGQKVLDQNIGTTTDQLNVSNLKNGAYLIQVTSEGQTGTYKFIKQ